MSEDKKYNGWSNYETWNVKLWADDDENSYVYWRAQTREAWRQAAEDRRYPGQSQKDSAACILADMLKSEHEENTPTVTGVYSDLLNAALSEVDWYEIAEAMLEDQGLKEEPESA